jgi:DNA helicase-2/ATP-dependent DNA helicase PcrA
MPAEIDLLAVDRGSVTAPAGCGKTQVIADNLAAHNNPKPVLILTHTNAGAAALRLRLQRAGVQGSAYRVKTIDGFSMQLIARFPLRGGHDPRILLVGNPREDYPAIRAAATRLLKARDIGGPLRATYSRLFVDEYQDCLIEQHAIVDSLAAELATAVLGDPMQAIFGFGMNQLVNWRANVEARFPAIGVLGTPWRWRNAGTNDLGQWLLESRAHLQNGRGVDLRGAPAEVNWIQLRAATADQQRRTAAQTRTVGNEETVLIIGDARNVSGQRKISSETPGATCVESLELKEFVAFARRFDIGANDAVEQLIEFAGDVITHVGPAALVARVETILRGRARTPPTPAEAAAVAFAQSRSIPTALQLLHELEQQPHARVFRPDVLRCLRSALRAVTAGGTTLHEAAIRFRERNRHMNRAVSRRAVGSTLLLKGLEADVAVILHPEGMNAANLYVALTRGARRLVVCSDTPVLMPAA